jgi:hypothetical protein
MIERAAHRGPGLEPKLDSRLLRLSPRQQGTVLSSDCRIGRDGGLVVPVTCSVPQAASLPRP